MINKAHAGKIGYTSWVAEQIASSELAASAVAVDNDVATKAHTLHILTVLYATQKNRNDGTV